MPVGVLTAFVSNGYHVGPGIMNPHSHPATKKIGIRHGLKATMLPAANQDSVVRDVLTRSIRTKTLPRWEGHQFGLPSLWKLVLVALVG